MTPPSVRGVTPESHSENHAPEVFPEISQELKDHQKMSKNTEKAFAEHQIKQQLSLQDFKENKPRVSFKIQSDCSIEISRNKKVREDAHFSIENEEGILAGVFDGHTDQGKIAALAARRFQEKFFLAFPQQRNQIKQLMQSILNEIHQEVLDLKLGGGSTAAICFVNCLTHGIYVATLGDAEVKLFRPKGQEIEPFPLSCVRTWKSVKDQQRFFSQVFGSLRVELQENWSQQKDATSCRYPLHYGLNVSRSLGDNDCIIPSELSLTGQEKPAISQKAKISFFQVCPGDLIILGSDGLWGKINEKELIDQVLKPNWHPLNAEINFASEVVKFAKELKTRDDITAVAIQVL
jgi:serine/threonine protein phosphatase PrpC